jgi:hypothetical protein
MIFYIKQQENYSRSELLLRTFLGFIYIGIPHAILLYILNIGMFFCQIALFFIILFTGKYPKGIWDYVQDFTKYSTRVAASLLNLSDGYPEFGLSGNNQNIDFSVPYKEDVSRLRLLGRWFFGWILLIPHVILMYLRIIGLYFIVFAAWCAVLFTGKYPKGMYDFVEGTFRHYLRIFSWIMFFTDEYPEFTGSPTQFEHEELIKSYN